MKLFQLIVILKGDFNCWSSFALSWVHEVTGTYCFVLVIVNFPASVELVITQVDDPVKMKLTSQLINDIQEFSKDYLNISMAQLFQHLVLYDHQQLYFLLFLF